MKTRRQGENQDMREWGGGGIGSPERQSPNAKHEQEITLQFAEHHLRGRKKGTAKLLVCTYVLGAFNFLQTYGKKREWPQSSVGNSTVKAAVKSCPSVCLGTNSSLRERH